MNVLHRSRLKRLAQTNHRSLQGELKAILERAARMAPNMSDGPELPLITAHTGGISSWRREDLYGPAAR